MSPGHDFDPSERTIRAADTPREILRRYGQIVSYDQVWRAVRDGVVPAQRVGWCWWLRDADLELLARAHGIDPNRPREAVPRKARRISRSSYPRSAA